MTPPKRLAHLHKLALFHGANNSPDAVEPLTDALLNDPSDIVRHEAAFLLGDLQKQNRLTASATDATQLQLINALRKDLSVLVAHEIALSLASFPSAETIKELVRAATKWAASEVESSVVYSLVDMLERGKEAESRS